MPVEYRRLPASLSVDREEVSLAQYILLTEIEPDLPAEFNVNEGHRTPERQQELIDEKGLWSPSNPFGAAPVSPTAPHIKTGQIDHALDCQRPDTLVTEARHEGVDYRYTVPTEGWHVEPDEDDLERFIHTERKKRKAAVTKAKKAKRNAHRAVLRAAGKLKKARARERAAVKRLKEARS